MVIKGFSKLTLLDYPGKLAAEIFTGGCNFSCPFCHNALLVNGCVDSVDEDEIIAYLKKRRGTLEGLAITGGEPLLNSDIADFIEKVRSLGYKIKLDTNGSFPGRLRELTENGLVDYVAMDIKNSKRKYAMTVGKNDFDLSPIEESVGILLENRIACEFRTTAVKPFHERSDFEEISEWIRGAEKFCLQSFVRSGDLLSDAEMEAFTTDELDTFFDIMKKTVKCAEKRYG